MPSAETGPPPLGTARWQTPIAQSYPDQDSVDQRLVALGSYLLVNDAVQAVQAEDAVHLQPRARDPNSARHGNRNLLKLAALRRTRVLYTDVAPSQLNVRGVTRIGKLARGGNGGGNRQREQRQVQAS